MTTLWLYCKKASVYDQNRHIRISECYFKQNLYNSNLFWLIIYQLVKHYIIYIFSHLWGVGWLNWTCAGKLFWLVLFASQPQHFSLVAPKTLVIILWKFPFVCVKSDNWFGAILMSNWLFHFWPCKSFY